VSVIDPVQLGVLGLRQVVAERHLGMEGLYVWRERWPPVAHRWISDDRRDVFSVSKTFTSVAIGIARAEGLLDLDDPVGRPRDNEMHRGDGSAGLGCC
jgi:hypothetical protein